MATAEYPTGADLIAAYKRTGAIPDYGHYWQQNGHLHACAVGVLLGASALDRGKDPHRSLGQVKNEHAFLAKQIGLGSDDGERRMHYYENGVHDADDGRTAPWTSCAYGRPDYDLGIAAAYDAGRAAWTEVLAAVERGELPSLSVGH